MQMFGTFLRHPVLALTHKSFEKLKDILKLAKSSNYSLLID